MILRKCPTEHKQQFFLLRKTLIKNIDLTDPLADRMKPNRDMELNE